MATTRTSKLAGGLRCTYGTTSFQVLLSNGRNVYVCSKEGADEFVDAVGTDFISTNMTTADYKELTLAYSLIFAVAENISPEKIASGIPESELRTFIERTRDALDTLSTDRPRLASLGYSVNFS
jgi:hypothetical protein